VQTLPCPGWGPSEDRLLLLGLWLYGIGQYDALHQDTVLLQLSRIAFTFESDGDAGGSGGGARLPWPGRDALDRRFRFLSKDWAGGSSHKATAKSLAGNAKPHQPSKVPKPKPSHGRASTYVPPPPPAPGPPVDADLKQAVTKSMLKFGDLPPEGTKALRVVSSELGSDPGVGPAEIAALSQRVRSEWEHMKLSEKPEKVKKAKNKLTRLDLCNQIRQLATRSLPPIPTAPGDGLPRWWISPAHDQALLRGSAAHGFNMYEQIFKDKTLFGDAPPGFNAMSEDTQAALFKRIRTLLNTTQGKEGGKVPAGQSGAGLGSRASPPPPTSHPAQRAPSSVAPPKKQFREWGRPAPPPQAQPPAGNSGKRPMPPGGTGANNHTLPHKKQYLG